MLERLFKIQLPNLNLMTILVLFAGCAYFNTYYNAQNYFGQGMKLVTDDTLKSDSEFFDKTIEKSTLVIVKYPTSRWVDDALLLMGISYYYKGDYARALEKLDLFCLNYPDSKLYARAKYYKGLTHFKEQKYNNAILALNEAKESRKLKKKVSLVLCYIYSQQGNNTALEEMTKGLLKGSLSLQARKDVLNLLGGAQFNLKLYDEALATFNEILVLSRTAEEKKILKLKIAKIYLQLDKYEECRKFLAGESDAEFRVLLADLSIELRNIQEAKDLYKEVIALGQSNYTALAYYNLACLYEDADSIDQAIAYYDSASLIASDTSGLKAKRKADVLKRIISLTKEAENADRSQFLLAELYFVDLSNISQAQLTYKKVYTDYPASKWAPKARYAEFWITKNILKNDSLAASLANELIAKYPLTEYSISAETIMKADDTDNTQEPKDNE